jgi:hypothetical protein
MVWFKKQGMVWLISWHNNSLILDNALLIFLKTTMYKKVTTKLHVWLSFGQYYCKTISSFNNISSWFTVCILITPLMNSLNTLIVPTVDRENWTIHRTHKMYCSIHNNHTVNTLNLDYVVYILHTYSKFNGICGMHVCDVQCEYVCAMYTAHSHVTCSMYIWM